MEISIFVLHKNLAKKSEEEKTTFDINNIENQSKAFNMTKTCSALKVAFDFFSIPNENVTNFYSTDDNR
jgi:hypothetical protein